MQEHCEFSITCLGHKLRSCANSYVGVSPTNLNIFLAITDHPHPTTISLIHCLSGNCTKQADSQVPPLKAPR